MKQLLRLCAAAIACLLPARASLGQTTLTTGLVTWLQFDDTAGPRALDASGTGKAGTLVNGGAWETARAGRAQGALHLTPGQYVSIPLAWRPARFSVAWWVHADSRREWNQTIRADYNGGDWGAFLFHTASDGAVYVGTDINTRLAAPAGTFQTGVWQHFAFTYDNGQARLYKNGALLTATTGMGAPAAWTRLTIGYGAPLDADGQYDDFRVYDRALTGSEVTQLRNSTVVAYTPPSNPSDDLDRNWGFVRSFDGKGNVIGESKSFSDALGRPTQAQAKNMTSGHVLATQTINNSGGKGALSTLPAPIDNQEFKYKTGFITTNGSDYKSDDFEGSNANSPRDVDQPTTPGTLGYYYSLNNTLEPLTAITKNPYSIIEEYAGPLGGPKRSAAPGDEMRLGGSHNTRMRDFPLLNDLDHYLSLRPQFVAGTPVDASLRAKGEKAVSVDVNGRESVVFTDGDGKTLASCLTGPQYPGLLLTAAIHSDPTNAAGLPQYQDIHIPAAGAAALKVTGTGQILLVDLLTDATQVHTSPTTLSLAPGFYRVVSKSDNQALSYQARYGDFSYSFYDDAGRVVATIGPKGVGAPGGAATASPTTGRAGHWSFDEATGTTAADASGNNLGGTLMNQLSWNTNQSGSVSAIPASPAGGSFLVFDGQDDYVRVGDVAALRMSSTLSLEAWIYPTRDQSGIIVNKETEYEVARFEDGSIQWAFNNASPAWNWVNTGIIAPLNTWSHIGLTYNNGVVTAYLNGVQVGTSYNGAGNINYSAGEFWIGGRSCCTQFFHGAIDEVRVWSGVQQPSTSALGPLSYVTRNTYSGTGTLLATESPDEGRTEYVYARDGRIRFSQSPVQRQQSKFSYTNYDEAGRVVELGEYTPTATVVGQLEAEQAQTNGQVEYGVPGASNGQDVGYLTEVGRYVLFQGYVGQSVPHALDFRYSAAGTVARTMSLYIDGVDVEQVRLPATGGWTNWATQRAVVNLAVGYHTIMLRMDADDSGWVNLDYLLGSALTGHVFESQLPVVRRYEAEAANTGCGQSSTPGQGSGCNPPATNHPGYHGSGFIGDLTSQGRFVEFTVNVPVAGRYPVHIRYAAALANSDRAMPVYVNWNYVFHANFAPTNSWSRWETQTIDVDLQAGSNLIRFQHDGRANEGWFNLDYIDVATPRQPASNSVLSIVEELMPTNSLNTANCSQRNQMWHDLPVADSQLGSRTQEFTLGEVAKTSTGTTTSWYSYDELGRLAWLVQEAPGVGVKSVDYTYDLNGNVLEVAYQKGQPDAFYHHYEYDADQRLRAAYTSTDGQALNRTLQARYFYYLHGPLKRVELGDRLQGIDYAYTIQGWVKSINQANRSLDPGADKPTTNGFYKDLFGLTLDYFSGDYQSRQLTLPQPYIWTNHNEMRHDGTVRASSWFTPASADTRAYAYRYDAKGQLTQADYGQMNGGSYFSISGTKANEEGNLSYDAHGNIQTLRRRDGLGTATDDFLYDYTANTNKLAAVKSRTTNDAVLSYQYDANGQMIRETEAGKGDKYLTYDVSGKVTGVHRDEAHQQPVATFVYNDRGFRTSKTSYTAQGVVSNVTFYVTDTQGNVLSTYEQPAGGNVTQTEIPLYAASRVGTVTRLDDGSLEPRYELNDQLGNARVVFRKPVTKKYAASMETSEANREEQDFSNLPATRVSRATARSGFYVARLKSPLTTWGPTKELQMQKGDTLTFSAYASYYDGFTQQPSEARTAVIAPYLAAGAVTNGLTRPLPGPDATGRRRRSGLGQLTAGLSITGLLHAATQSGARTTSVPIAGIRLRVYEGSSTTVAEEITIPLTAVAASGWELLRRGYRMPYAGRIEVTTYNYDSGQHVYFDDIEVEHSTGLIVQEQHQYAFGSPITGLNYTVGNKMYRHGYQGQYAEKDEETGWDSFELRMYNSRIGRWTAPDPYRQFHSPYVGMGNDPIGQVDPDGGLANPGIGSYLRAAMNNTRVLTSGGQIVGFMSRSTLSAIKAAGSGLLNASLGAAAGVVRANGIGSAMQGGDKNRITPKSMGLGDDATAEEMLVAFMKTKPGSYLEGDDLEEVSERLSGPAAGIKRLYRVAGGIKPELSAAARFMIAVVPHLNVNPGATIEVKRELWGDGKTDVMHLRSMNVTIPYDKKENMLDIYINNNGYTMEKGPKQKINKKTGKTMNTFGYYGIFKGNWNDRTVEK